jgi:DNA-binding response OmpR family regulator
LILAGAMAGSNKEVGDGVNENLAEKTILIVDDEDVVRESVREVLSDEGYRVVDTGDGTTVLRMIEEEKPGLVLLDIWMPQTDGIELLKEIKNKSRTSTW